MTSKEFVLWLKGFTEGVHEYNITPKQWDLLKEKLEQVSDENRIGTPIGQGGWGTPNHDLVERYPWGGQKIWAGDPIDCSKSGTTIPNYAVTTTPGTTGFVTIGNPSAMILSGSGQLWQTSTTYNPQSGSWHYTNGGNDIKD